MDWTETLNLLGKWWNNSVAFANATGVTTMLVAFAYVYINHKLKKKNQAITIDVSQSSKETERLAEQVKRQNDVIVGLQDDLKLLTTLLFNFANGTKIDDKVKDSLAQIYGQISAKDKKDVKQIVDNVKEKVDKAVETVKEVAEPVLSNYEKVKQSILSDKKE